MDVRKLRAQKLGNVLRMLLRPGNKGTVLQLRAQNPEIILRMRLRPGIKGTVTAAKAAAINRQRQTTGLEKPPAQPDRVKIRFWQLISVNDKLDLTKLQMLLFTVLTGVYVVVTVLRQVAFPTIPTERLTLMGISNGIYVLGKVTTTEDAHGILAGLHSRMSSLDQENKILESNKKEKDKADTTSDTTLTQSQKQKKTKEIDKEIETIDKQITKLEKRK